MKNAFQRVLAAFLLIAGLQAGVSAQPPGSGLERALDLLSSGQMSEAIAALEQLTATEPDNDQARAILGGLYAETGRAAEALELLTPLADPETADPAVLYNAGRAALRLGRIDEAAAYLARSAGAAPDSPARRELGLLRGRQGLYDEAFILLMPWARANPEDTEARLAAALSAIQLERVPDAEELLSDMPQENPGVRLLWGKLLIMKGDPWGAMGTLTPLLETAGDETSLDLRRTLAQAHLLVGQADEAIELLEGRVGNDPGLALQLSHAHYQTGDVAGALATMKPFAEPLTDQGEEIAPGAQASLAASIAIEYGNLLIADGRAADALPYLEIGTQLAPENKLGWKGLGQSLAAVGRREEAKEALNRFQEITHSEVPPAAKEMALEADIEDPTGRRLREAMRLLAQGRPEEALAVTRREIQMAPEDHRSRLVESRILLALDRNTEAVSVAEATLAQVPENADAHYQHGVVMMATGDLERAETDFRRALSLSPDHTAAMSDLAVLLMQQGGGAEARQLLNRVLELRPGDPVATRNLEQLGG